MSWIDPLSPAAAYEKHELKTGLNELESKQTGEKWRQAFSLELRSPF